MEDTKSRFTDYSMSSSIIRRNENLKLLDDQFEQVKKKKYIFFLRNGGESKGGHRDMYPSTSSSFFQYSSNKIMCSPVKKTMDLPLFIKCSWLKNK